MGSCFECGVGRQSRAVAEGSHRLRLLWLSWVVGWAAGELTLMCGGKLEGRFRDAGNEMILGLRGDAVSSWRW